MVFLKYPLLCQDWNSFFYNIFDILYNFHNEILLKLFTNGNHDIYNDVKTVFENLKGFLNSNKSPDYSFVYDQIVVNGELLSTKIINAYLNYKGLKSNWIDSRELNKTDSNYRDSDLIWNITQKNISSKIDKRVLNITQGFIASDENNFNTTLGREGSDYSAAIYAYCLNAVSLTIWKDVPGFLNADPKVFDNPILLECISYEEAIELAFYGATVIHPKTLQPLQKKEIPLFVKSFLNPEKQGSEIAEGLITHPEIPSFIAKENQVLISIADENLAFIIETHMSQIFSILAKHRVSVNLMQNSAVSFSICVDNDSHKIPQLVEDLKGFFKVFCVENLSLFTIRHYTDESIQLFLQDKEIVLEQKAANTMQLVAR